MKLLEWSKDPELVHTSIPNFYRLHAGPFTVWRDSFTFSLTKKVFWNINFSWPRIGTDNILVGDDREFGPGKRLEFTIWPFGYWLISLDDQRFSKWTFSRGWRHPDRPAGRVVWTPPRSLHCENPVDVGCCKKDVCGGWKFHKCPYTIFPV